MTLEKSIEVIYEESVCELCEGEGIVEGEDCLCVILEREEKKGEMLFEVAREN
jgi:hypothetical protein